MFVWPNYNVRSFRSGNIRSVWDIKSINVNLFKEEFNFLKFFLEYHNKGNIKKKAQDKKINLYIYNHK